MTDKASIGAGDVEIYINGKDYVLKPSLRAAKTLSRKYNGTANIVQQLTVMNFDTFVDVIKQGASLTDHGAKDLEEDIYLNGLFDISAPCIRFIHILSNGGRPPGEEAENPQKADPS